MADGKVEYEVRADLSKLDSDLSRANQKVVKSANETAGKQEKAEEKSVKAVKTGEAEKLTAVEKTASKSQSKITESARSSTAEISRQSAKSEGAISSTSAGIIKSVGKAAVAIGAVTAAIAGVKKALEEAGNAEYSFAKVQTLLTGGNQEKYYEQLKTLSNETGVAVDELAESMYQALSAGVAQDKAVEFVANSIKLAKGGFTDTASAIDVVTTALNAYGLEAEQAAHVQDVLITTQNLGKTTVDELANSMGQIIPTADSVNVSLDQLGASYAVITSNGVATAEATTYMNSMFNELASTTGTASAALAEATAETELAGKSFAQLMDEGYSVAEIVKIIGDYAESSGKTLIDMFSSSEAAKAATILSSNAEKYASALDSVINSTGAADSASATMMDTFNAKWNILKTNLNNLLIELGEELMPVAEELMQLIMDNLPEIKELVSDVGQIMITVVKDALPLLETVIGFIVDFKDVLVPLTVGLGAAKIAMDAFTLACSVNPIVLAIAAIAAMAAGIAVLINYVNTCSDEVNALARESENLRNSIDETISSGESELQQLDEKAARYEELRSQVYRTAEQEAELGRLAGELQGILGDNVAVIDANTGAYNDLSIAVEDYIGRKMKEITLSAYEDKVKQIITQQEELKAQVAEEKAKIKDKYTWGDEGSFLGNVGGFLSSFANTAVDMGKGLIAGDWETLTAPYESAAADNNITETEKQIAENQKYLDEWTKLLTESYTSSYVAPVRDLTTMSDSERLEYYRNLRGGKTKTSDLTVTNYSSGSGSSGTKSNTTSTTGTKGSTGTTTKTISAGSTGSTASTATGGNVINIQSYIPTVWDTAAEANAKLKAGGVASSLVGNSKSGKVISGLTSNEAARTASGSNTVSETTLSDVVKAIKSLKTAQEKMQYTLDVTLKTDDYTLAKATVAGIKKITKQTGKSPL